MGVPVIPDSHKVLVVSTTYVVVVSTRFPFIKTYFGTKLVFLGSASLETDVVVEGSVTGVFRGSVETGGSGFGVTGVFGGSVETGGSGVFGGFGVFGGSVGTGSGFGVFGG